MLWTHESLRRLADAHAMSQARRDKEIVSVMLAAGPQASLDYPADAVFAQAILGREPKSIKEEGAMHRRRIAALGALVNDGVAESAWVGVSLDGGHHGARRSRTYWLTDD